ncbi:cornichon homolog 2-like protein [Drosera capensis]
MDSDSILWLLIVVSIVALIAFIIYQIMCLSDLEADYVNPYESSSKVNAVVVPEFLVQGALCGVLLVSGRWFMFLGNVPLAYYYLRLNDWYEMHCESRLVALQALSVKVKGLMQQLKKHRDYIDLICETNIRLLHLFLRWVHLLDVTEIYRNLTREKKTRLKKPGVYLFFFFLAILSIPTGLFLLSALVSSKHGELDLRASFLEF